MWELIDRLQGLVSDAYRDVARTAEPISLRYVADWLDTGLAAALHVSRPDELRRGVARGAHIVMIC